MNSKNILILFFILLSTSFLTYYYYEYKKHPRTLAVLGEGGHKVHEFSFTNQDGQTITDKDVAGKIIVAEYFFTTCKSICPIMNENMVKVYSEFRNNENVVILSHTVDPEIDTPAQLKRYSLKFEASAPRWQFLTGTKAALYSKAINDYLVTAADSTKLGNIPEFIHTERFVLVDKFGRLRGQFYDGTNKGQVQQLIGDIKELLKEKD
jgi:protein SCO1